MGRGRPVKKGLTWYKKDVHCYDDFRIMDLMNEYGPIGYTVYDYLVGQIYNEGYYLDFPLDNICLAVMRAIGSKWLGSKEKVREIIEFCGKIGLFDRSLLQRGVLTSASIQRRYDDVCARNKADKSRYWLLNEEDGISAAKNRISAAKNTQEREEEKETEKETEKEIRGKRILAAPALRDVQAYCAEKDLRVDAERFFNYYDAVGWIQNGTPIVNWKAVMQNWNRREYGKAEAAKPAHTPSYDLKSYEEYDIFAAEEMKTKQNAQTF